MNTTVTATDIQVGDKIQTERFGLVTVAAARVAEVRNHPEFPARVALWFVENPNPMRFTLDATVEVIR